jgi:D-tyrosyl-tRNA(Tyr) deacylase
VQPTTKQTLNLNCRANRVQTKACFQYAEVQQTIKRSLNFKPQISIFKNQMRLVIQRASHASVTIEGQVKSQIGCGLLILMGICDEDTQEDIDWLVRKVVMLRVFDDENGVMNRSVMDINGDIMVVSQFTLYASYKKGNRPSWIKASHPTVAIPLYEQFCERLSAALGKPVATGEFGADMKVELVNDGPVTICMDTKNKE